MGTVPLYLALLVGLLIIYINIHSLWHQRTLPNPGRRRVVLETAKVTAILSTVFAILLALAALL